MNKYSKKKNLWNVTLNLQTGPICIAVIAAGLAIFYVIGAVISWLFKKGHMGFLDNLMIGFSVVLFATIIILSIWNVIIGPILKQFAIARYCRLPLTEEEIKIGIETGDFSSLSTYFAYLNKQMNYGICDCLKFTKEEITLVINNGINVFKPRDDEYFELPECIYATLDESRFGGIYHFADDVVLLRSNVVKVTGIPAITGSWGLYGKAYKEKIKDFDFCNNKYPKWWNELR